MLCSVLVYHKPYLVLKAALVFCFVFTPTKAY